MGKEFSLPFEPGFEINSSYALLVGMVMIIYSRFESTVVDITGFHKKGYRSGYYCREILMPRHLLSDLSGIGKSEDREVIEKVFEGFGRAVKLRNAIDHSVPCYGPDGYDVLHFQQGTVPRSGKFKYLNPYRGKIFDYDFLLEESKQMVEDYRVAARFFDSLRDRSRKGEEFPGEPC